MPITINTLGDNWPSSRDFVNMLACQVAEEMSKRIPDSNVTIDLIFSNRNACTSLGNNHYQIEVVFKAEYWGEFVYGFGEELFHSLTHCERLTHESNWCNEALSHALGIESVRIALEANRGQFAESALDADLRIYLSQNQIDLPIPEYFTLHRQELEEGNYAMSESREKQKVIGQFWLRRFQGNQNSWSILWGMNPINPVPSETLNFFNSWIDNSSDKEIINELANDIGIKLKMFEEFTIPAEHLCQIGAQ